MKQYLQIYCEFFKTSLAEAGTYRINFFLLFLVDMAFYLSSYAPIDFIFSHVGHIGIWNREQFLFFVSFTLLVDHLHLTFLSVNFWELSEDLKLGRLDFVLLKPVSSIFIVFFRHVRISALPSGAVAWGLAVYFASKAGLDATGWILLVPMVVLSFILMALLEFLLSTLMFWTTEGIGVNFMRMQLQAMGRYPDFIYRTFIRRLFTFVLPILTALSAPCHFLFERQWEHLAVLVGSIAVFSFILLKTWKVALGRYESASS